MKGWRERAADIFTKHGESRQKRSPPRVPSNFDRQPPFVALRDMGEHAAKDGRPEVAFHRHDCYYTRDAPMMHLSFHGRSVIGLDN